MYAEGDCLDDAQGKKRDSRVPRVAGAEQMTPWSTTLGSMLRALPHRTWVSGLTFENFEVTPQTMYDDYWKWIESAAYFPGIWYAIEAILGIAALLTFLYVAAWGITTFFVYLATRCCCPTSSSSTPSSCVCCWKPQKGGRNARAVFLGLGLAAILGSAILAAAYVPPAHHVVTKGLDIADRGATFLETISASVSALRTQTRALSTAFDVVVLTNGTQSLSQQQRNDLTTDQNRASAALSYVRFADEALQNGYAKMIRNYTDDVTTYADDYRERLNLYTALAVAVTAVFCVLVAFTSWPVLFAGESVDPLIGWSDGREVKAEESLPLTGRTGVSKSPWSSPRCNKACCCRESANLFDITTIVAFCVVALIALGTFGAGTGLQTASIVLSDACEDPRAFLSDDRLKINSVAYHYAVCDDPEGGAVNTNLDFAAQQLDDAGESVFALYNSTRSHPHLSVSTAWLLANLTSTRTAIAVVRQSALCTTTRDLTDDVLGLLCDDSVEILFVVSIVLVVGTGMALVVSSVLATRCCTRCTCCRPRMASEPSACVWPCRGQDSGKLGGKPGDVSMVKFTPVMPTF